MFVRELHNPFAHLHWEYVMLLQTMVQDFKAQADSLRTELDTVEERNYQRSRELHDTIEKLRNDTTNKVNT